MARVVCWFSCGAASAVAAKIAIEKYTDLPVVVVYCNTSADEHADNKRFFAEVEWWLGRRIEVISSETYRSVEEVWVARKYMAGIAGAPCTVEMKKLPRFNFAQVDDINVFGFTADEHRRIRDFESHNPELTLDWVLRDGGITKLDCFRQLNTAGIELPVMYHLGFKNNNCIGCVKASSPRYWAMVREHFPEVFKRRAVLSRKIGARLTRIKLDGEWVRIFLDELPSEGFTTDVLEDVSCGPDCRPTGVSE